MKNRINQLFATKKKNILSVYFTAGFPQLDSTMIVAKSAEEAGADCIEIGIPFSDPVADGPVIQRSNKVALDNGMNLKLLLQQVKQIRAQIKLPIILMGYINPVLQYGVAKFCNDAADAGVDGLILPDLPFYEYETEYKKIVEQHHLANIFLVAPTTSDDRIRQIDEATNSFIYAVSSSSTTGAKKEFSNDQEKYFRHLKSLKLKNPFLIGFGISNASTFHQACAFSNGAIIGSEFIRVIENSTDLSTSIKSFISSLKE